MGNVLILAEHQNGKVKKTAFELASKASEIASSLGGQAEAVLIGTNDENLSKELAAYGIKKVYLLECPALEKYNAEGYTKVLADLIAEVKPEVLLAAATPVGKSCMPRLSGKLNSGLVSDVVDLKVDGSKVIATHPIYSGKALVDVKVNGSPQMLTIRPNSFGAGSPQDGATAESIKKTADAGELKSKMVDLVQGASDKVDLTEAELIVSGGRAMKSSDNFKILDDLAATIGATVGASRAAVDSGYAPHDMQVGQTGKVVNPKLYMAFGISGAIQHLAGMRTSKVIVAVNKDPEAPIFQKADYGIVADLFEVVPMLTEEFKKAMNE